MRTIAEGRIRSEWRTRIDPALTAKGGVAELHVVCFEPIDDHGGRRPVVCISVPEASRQTIRKGLKIAARREARVLILCDTAEQAITVGAMAPRLRRHRRVPYERAEAGGWGRLS